MKIYIGSDHAGVELKELIKSHFNEKFEFEDAGTFTTESVDYPDFAHKVAESVLSDEGSFGILICGTGNGMAITANKHAGIRAALCWAPEIAALAKDSPKEFVAMKRCKLLGIDDLGTEAVIVKSYGNELSPLAELLATRYSSRLFTVITTNLSVREVGGDVWEDELKAIYGDRILDRLREMCNTIFYDGEQQSYRV